jgi:serine/threonine protein kinase
MASESKEGSERDIPPLNVLKGAIPNTTLNKYYAMYNGMPLEMNSADIPYLNSDELHDLRIGLKEYYSTRLSEEETEKLIANALAIPKQVNRGSGSFGLVVSPALPNVIHGQKYRFPSQVTKVLYLKNTRKNTLNTANRIRRKVPELYYNILPYERKVTLANISNPTIKAKLKEKIAKKTHTGINSIHNNTELYPVRMKDMGYSIDSYFASAYRLPRTELYKSLLRIPFRTILANMSKLAGIVDRMNELGYVHLDIRETNVLCNPNSGELQIIDFDFFMKVTDYYTRYTNIFYAHPVEEAILKSQENRDIIETIMYNPIDFKRIPKVLYKKLYKILEPQCTILYHTLQPFSGSSVDVFINNILVNEFIPGLEGFKEHIYTAYGPPDAHEPSVYIDNYISVMYNDLINTIDSYGLGIAFQQLVKVYDYYGLLSSIDDIFKYYPWLQNSRIHLNKFKEVLKKAIEYVDLLSSFDSHSRLYANQFKRLIDELIDNYNAFYRTEGLPKISKRSTRKRNGYNISKRLSPIVEANNTNSESSSSLRTTHKRNK